MAPITLRSTSIIRVPAAEAWTFLSDYARDTGWRHGLLRMEADPAGRVIAGTLAFEELRVLGRTIRSRIEVTKAGTGSFSWQVLDGSRAHGTRRVEPLDERSCRLVLEKTVELEGAIRLLRPLVAAVLRKTEREDAIRAARIIEASTTIRPGQ